MRDPISVFSSFSFPSPHFHSLPYSRTLPSRTSPPPYHSMPSCPFNPHSAFTRSPFPNSFIASSHNISSLHCSLVSSLPSRITIPIHHRPSPFLSRFLLLSIVLTTIIIIAVAFLLFVCSQPSSSLSHAFFCFQPTSSRFSLYPSSSDPASAAILLLSLKSSLLLNII